ncbi:hypothetical protein BBO99_00000308 [Phytophthora kernoviae]|uniref:Uncharacterized protein n=2 Tax=Phytophthora kernoviae TaxID=325452 RepID=A0A3F2S302_9STRA|nr:hypothetical protein G195_000808 [Phytophthora kernoviae 00238/432]KAG2532815.1 hypothetical protein JM16_000066 [Phytophthora kernoviae]KAG2533570.1 hypothetical protein JM18_000068 [Phytophthora kernoviae]RLN11128.1 hypothetical protein BBI17_000153 [Phytophthora kernoviae]RLN63058.1 hypothetical protein BBJ29_001844 [Phytophthora kernoviae]
MGRPRVTVAAVALSGVTGMTLASVSLLAYMRFQHPQEFADASIRMTNPEGVKNLFAVPDMAERYELQKKKREQQIRQSLEDFRPK